MDESSDVLKIAREDVLRLAMEKGGSASVEDIAKEVGDRELADKAIESLTREGLIEKKDGIVSLTSSGRRFAENIFRKHSLVEAMAKDHRIAHFLEHIDVEPGTIREFVSRGKFRRLTELSISSTGRVIAVTDPRPSLVARVYGVGLLPGRRVRVVARSRGLVVLEVGSEARVVALDEDIAGKVLVVVEPCPRGESGKE
ncbi:hypothetical protein PYJP_02130 [Pyrofollis japonicus]|uniref:FeoA domain-containing protein n=1 Tax=Pyrofollis japonicus TaxID=3060460 RepID=UPI00295AEF6A|nr:FeoA domain-containing protein [Pyrofollis japonicus]BEP16861.1 hypothetical protein PYJP_02130 [Pyrofollis japonicus]